MANRTVKINTTELISAPKSVYNVRPFFNKNKRQLMRLQPLRNCSLVIDGSNMLVELASGTWWVHGGDLDIYVARIYTILGALKKANIQPIFFFDGPSTDSKIYKSVDRAATVLHYVREINNGCSTDCFPLSFINHGYREQLIFRDILETQQLQTIQVVSPQGYLQEMVACARYLKVPLVSSNNLLYFYELGETLFIPTADFISHGCCVQRDERGCLIKVFCYHRDQLALYFSCTPSRSLFSIALAMLRNQDGILKKFYVPSVSIPYDDHRNRTRVEQTFQFLSQYSTEQAKEFLLGLVPLDMGDQLNLEFDEADDCCNVSPMNVLRHFAGFTPPLCIDDYTLPSWFVRDFIDGKLPNFFFHVLANRAITWWTLVEDLSLPSVDLRSIQLRQYIYGILLAYDPNPDTVVVTEKLRQGKGIFSTQVTPLWRIVSCDDPVPALDDVQMLSESERQKIFLSMLDVPDVYLEEISSKKVFSILVLRYWFMKVPNVKQDHVLALLLSVAAVDTAVALGELSSSLFNGKVVLRIEQINRMRPHDDVIDVSWIHTFSELQAVLRDLKFLHRLLQHPYGLSNEVEDIDRFIKSSFIHEIIPYLTNSSGLIVEGEGLLLKTLNLVTMKSVTESQLMKL